MAWRRGLFLNGELRKAGGSSEERGGIRDVGVTERTLSKAPGGVKAHGLCGEPREV